MANNLIEIIGTIDQIVFVSPKWFWIFNIKIDPNFESDIPFNAYPKLWEKLVKVVGFIWKDFELIEWYKIKISWNFDNRDEKYVSAHNKDYSPELEFKLKGDIDLVWWLESLSWLKAYLVRYIPWVWEKQADVLINSLWLDNVISILDSKDAIEKLLDVKWIWNSKADNIKLAWDEWKVERNILIELGWLWLSINKCWLVYKTWWSKYKEYLENDPYRLTEIKWIWFAIADEVAMNSLWIGKKDDRRYAWIVEFVVREYAWDNWDTIISIDSIKEGIKKFIASDIEFNSNDILIIAERWIEKAIEKNTLFRINHKTYALWYFAYIESQIFKKIKEGYDMNVEMSKWLKDHLDNVAATTPSTPEQLQAIEYAYTKWISIVLWWAWTWKTFTVWNMIEWFIKNNIDYFIVTPTNKASARVREVNPKASVSTIHSLLGIKPWEDPMYNEENPLPYSKLVIDETSMLDNKIAHKLLSAIDFNKTSIILVWDDRQLPPVDAWSFFYDLKNSWFLDENITVLTEVKRSNNAIYDELKKAWHKITIIKEGIHNIVANALRILDWKMPLNTWFDSFNMFSNFENYDLLNWIKSKEISIFDVYKTLNEKDIPEPLKLTVKDLWELETLNKIKDTYIKMKNKWVDVNKDFQLYVPTYKWNLWIPKLNVLISDLINDNPIIKLDRWQEYKINDKVVFSENNKELWLTKWDVWIIKDISPINNVVIVEFYWQWTIEIKNSDLDSLELWYCLSVHKAQWTEIKYGWVLLLNSFYMLLNNQLLYTAYTRCKEKVFLFWEEKAYLTALKTHVNVRNTLLFHLLAWTPTDEIYPNVSRKNFSISDSELKHIKETISIKKSTDNDNVKIIKVSYSEINNYQYYRYIYGDKELLWKLNLYDGILISNNELNEIIKENIVFLRIKKYSSKSEKRWFTKKIVDNNNALLIEINSDDKEISIS